MPFAKTVMLLFYVHGDLFLFAGNLSLFKTGALGKILSLIRPPHFSFTLFIVSNSHTEVT